MSQQDQTLVLQREMLKEAMSGALRDIPGAVALYVFGSSALGISDSYSDIDLQVYTTSLRESLCALHHVIHHVGRAQLEWLIRSDERTWAATLLFDTASPYHKIDLGFTKVNSKTPSEGSEHGVLMWKQEPAPAFPNKNRVPPYSPNPDSLDYVVIG
jgi:predicted nucleotidyltransferase